MAEDRRYVELVTDDFTLVSGVSEKRTRDIATHVGAFQSLVEQTFGISISNALPLRIHALTEEDWASYAQPRERVAGYFVAQPFSSDLVFDAEDTAGGAFELMFHEYAHYIIRTSWAGDVPPFLDEGLAEVLSSARFENGTVRILPRADYVRFLRRHEWLPFERLLEVRRTDAEYVDHALAPAFYAQSWATVYYALATNPDFADHVTAYARDLDGSAARIQAAERLMGAASAQANREIARYIRQRKPLPVARLKFVAPALDVRLELRRLGSEEATLSLAELMLRLPHHYEEAGRLFDDVLKNDADGMRPRIGVAWAKLRVGDTAEAARVFDSLMGAEGLAPADAVSLARGIFQVAAAGSQDSDELSAVNRDRFMAARRLFEQGMNDRRTHLEAVNGYVLASLALGQADESLIPVAQDAYRSAPRSAELAVALAILHETTGRKPLARKYWEDAAQNSHTAPLRARVLKALESNTRDGAAVR